MNTGLMPHTGTLDFFFSFFLGEGGRGQAEYIHIIFFHNIFNYQVEQGLKERGYRNIWDIEMARDPKKKKVEKHWSISSLVNRRHDNRMAPDQSCDWDKEDFQTQPLHCLHNCRHCMKMTLVMMQECCSRSSLLSYTCSPYFKPFYPLYVESR